VGAFRDVIGGFHAWHIEECPQGLAFPQQPTSKGSGLVVAGTMLMQERVETRIPRPPLSYPWPRCPHMTEPLQLRVYAPSKVRN